jgi:hypothetical protein
LLIAQSVDSISQHTAEKKQIATNEGIGKNKQQKLKSSEKDKFDQGDMVAGSTQKLYRNPKKKKKREQSCRVSWTDMVKEQELHT